MRTLVQDTPQAVGQSVTLKGWVQSRRDHGGLIFIDVRDHTGIAQLVIQPEEADAFGVAEQLRDEFVISATGEVRERADGLKNPKLPTGSIELKVAELSILNRAEPMPIQIEGDAMASEELRLKYRYLDLRRPKMQTMLKRRANYYKFIRTYMDERDFTEVTTPILANSSPEGARDFLVPSRVHQGKFYALPQAPQQFKQLLMVGGLSRYYQLATCFRDEDPRADRLYGDFYQLDLEMAFVESGEEVRTTTEPLIKNLVTDFAGKTLLVDEIPRIPYQEAMETYGTDKPDLRFDLKLTDLNEIFKQTEFGVFKNADCIKAICVSGAASLSRSQIDKFTDIAKQEGAGGLPYIKYRKATDVTGQYEFKIPYDGALPESPIAKFLSEEEHFLLINKFKPQDGDVIFFGADSRDKVNKVLGRLRNEFADHFELKDPDVVALAWIIDFPFYEFDEKTQKLDFGHNPFSLPKNMPEGGVSTLSMAEQRALVADQYDMVMNGYEVCSGAVRNYNPDVMYEVFGALGYDKPYVDAKFGALINAFKFGAPPHAGCAYGIDRIFMILQDETNIREIVAFPKNGSGIDTMMDSPSSVDDAQLKELAIKPDLS